MASVLIATPEEVDTFGISSSNHAGHALIHFDLEQSRFDHWQLIERSLKRAGRNDAPAWLQSYCLTGYSAPDAWAAVQHIVRASAKDFRGIHSILIDGVADLCKDVNDPEESNALVASLHDMAIKNDCPIVGVIHFNPGSEKVRGHLGSQLERKCETNLRMEKVGEITTVWSEKQRRAPIFKDNGPKFRWCSVKGMHVTAKPEDDPIYQEEVERHQATIFDVFNGHPSMRYTDIISTVKSTVKCSDRTAERKVNTWVKYRLIGKSVAGLYLPTT